MTDSGSVDTQIPPIPTVWIIYFLLTNKGDRQNNVYKVPIYDFITAWILKRKIQQYCDSFSTPEVIPMTVYFFLQVSDLKCCRLVSHKCSIVCCHKVIYNPHMEQIEFECRIEIMLSRRHNVPTMSMRIE